MFGARHFNVLVVNTWAEDFIVFHFTNKKTDNREAILKVERKCFPNSSFQ